MKSNTILRTVATTGVMALALTACANQSGTSSNGDSGSGDSKASSLKSSIPALTSLQEPTDAVLPKGDGKGKCDPNTTIGYVGAITGPNAQLGVNIYQGIELAITEHNKANPDCQVKFSKLDTEGDPNKATGPVTKIVGDANVVGVVGLPFSGESKATGNIFEEKGLVHITPSATNPGLTGNGWKTFFRGLGNDAVQGPAAANFLTGKLGAKKVYLVQDDSDYGIGLADNTTKALGDKLGGTDKITTGQKDFSATIQKIISAKPDAVYFAGYYAEGAPFAQQLRAKGYTGTFVGPDGVKDDQFVKLAGDSAEGSYFTCPCIPGELLPTFSKAYKDAFKMEPGTYSIEGYDAATVLLSGIDKGKTSRADLLAYVKGYEGQGLSKKYKWDDKGELNKPTVYGYRVDNGKIVPVGPVGE